MTTTQCAHHWIIETAPEAALRAAEAAERSKAIADFLQGLGVPEWRAWLLAGSGKGWWRLAGSLQAAGPRRVKGVF